MESYKKPIILNQSQNYSNDCSRKTLGNPFICYPSTEILPAQIGDAPVERRSDMPIAYPWHQLSRDSLSALEKMKNVAVLPIELKCKDDSLSYVK